MIGWALILDSEMLLERENLSDSSWIRIRELLVGIQ